MTTHTHTHTHIHTHTQNNVFDRMGIDEHSNILYSMISRRRTRKTIRMIVS